MAEPDAALNGKYLTSSPGPSLVLLPDRRSPSQERKASQTLSATVTVTGGHRPLLLRHTGNVLPGAQTIHFYALTVVPLPCLTFLAENGKSHMNHHGLEGQTLGKARG